jgi:hypothetical protein
METRTRATRILRAAMVDTRGAASPPDDALPAVDTLIGGVVHELRNVIFAISVNLEALEVGGEASYVVG